MVRTFWDHLVHTQLTLPQPLKRPFFVFFTRFLSQLTDYAPNISKLATTKYHNLTAKFWH